MSFSTVIPCNQVRYSNQCSLQLSIKILEQLYNSLFISDSGVLPKKMRLYLALGALCLLASVLAKDDKKEKEDVGTVIGIDLGTTYSW